MNPREREHANSKGVVNMATNQDITQTELFKNSFYYLNSFKRHRALANMSRLEGNMEKANRHELKSYQFIDSLELSLRALQKGHRELDEE